MSTIEEIASFYMEERLSILRCGSRLLRGMMDASYSYHKEAMTIVKQLLTEGWLAEVKNQYVNSTKILVPKSPLTRHLAERWATQYVQEQAEILELVLHLHYDVVGRSMKEFLSWSAIFAREAYGARQVNYTNLTEEGQHKTRRVTYLSVLILLEMLDLEEWAGGDLYDTLQAAYESNSADLSKHTAFMAIRERLVAFEEVEKLMKEMGSLDAHGPLLLAWSAITSRVQWQLSARGIINGQQGANGSGSFGSNATIALLSPAASIPSAQASQPKDFSFLERLTSPSEYGRRATQLKAVDWMLKLVREEVAEAREGSMLAHRSVLAGWVLALTAAFDADELPFYKSLISLHAEIYKDEPALCNHFWNLYSQTPVWRALLDVATARFPSDFLSPLLLLSSLASDAQSAATVFFYLCDLPTYTQKLPIEYTEGAVTVHKAPLPFGVSPHSLPILEGALYVVTHQAIDIDLVTLPVGSVGRVLSMDAQNRPSLVQWSYPHSAWVLFIHYLDSFLHQLQTGGDMIGSGGYGENSNGFSNPNSHSDEISIVTALIQLFAQLFSQQPLMASSIHDHIIETELRLYGAPGAISAGLNNQGAGSLFMLPRLFQLLHLTSSLSKPPLQLITATLQCVKGIAFSHPQHVWSYFRRGLIESSESILTSALAPATAANANGLSLASQGPIRRVLQYECALGTYPVTLAFLDLAECLITYLQRWPANASQATVSSHEAYDSLGYMTPGTSQNGLFLAPVLDDKPDASDFGPCLQYIQTSLFSQYDSWRYTTLQHKSEIGLVILRIFERLLDDVPQQSPSDSDSFNLQQQEEDLLAQQQEFLAQNLQNAQNGFASSLGGPMGDGTFHSPSMTPLPRRTPAPAYSGRFTTPFKTPRGTSHGTPHPSHTASYSGSTSGTPFSSNRQNSSAPAPSMTHRTATAFLRDMLFNSLLYDVSCHTNILNILAIGPVALEFNLRRVKGGSTLVLLLHSAFTVLETVLLLKQDAVLVPMNASAGAGGGSSFASNGSSLYGASGSNSSSGAGASNGYPSLHSHGMPSNVMDIDESRVVATYSALHEITPLEASILQRKVGKYSLDLVYIIASYISYNYDSKIPTGATRLLTILCQLSATSPSDSSVDVVKDKKNSGNLGSNSGAGGVSSSFGPNGFSSASNGSGIASSKQQSSVTSSSAMDTSSAAHAVLSSLQGLNFRSTPISLVSYFGSMADTLRSEFLWRLSDSREPSELRKAIWRLMTESLSSQPGLAELFINIQSDTIEDDKTGSANSDKTKTGTSAPSATGASSNASSNASTSGIPNSSVSVVLALFMDDEQRNWYLKHDTQLLSEAFGFLTALWHVASDHSFVFSQIRSKPNFWMKLLSCISPSSTHPSDVLKALLNPSSNGSSGSSDMEISSKDEKTTSSKPIDFSSPINTHCYRLLINSFVFKIIALEIFLVPRGGSLDEGLVVELGKLLTSPTRFLPLLDEFTDLNQSVGDARELLIKTLSWLNIDMPALLLFPSQRNFGPHFMFNTRLLMKKLGLSNRNTMSEDEGDELSLSRPSLDAHGHVISGASSSSYNGSAHGARGSQWKNSRFGLLSTLSTLTAIDPVSGEQIDVMERISQVNVELSYVEAKKEALKSVQQFLQMVLLRQANLHLPESDTLLSIAHLMALKLGQERRESVAALNNVDEVSAILLLCIKSWTRMSNEQILSGDAKSSKPGGSSRALSKESSVKIHAILQSVNDALFWLTSKSLSPRVCETLLTILHLMLNQYENWSDKFQEISISLSTTCINLMMDSLLTYTTSLSYAGVSSAMSSEPMVGSRYDTNKFGAGSSSSSGARGAQVDGKSFGSGIGGVSGGVGRGSISNVSSGLGAASGSSSSGASSSRGDGSSDATSSSSSLNALEGKPVEARLFALSISLLSTIATHSENPSGSMLRCLKDTNALGVLVKEVERQMARREASDLALSILSFFLALSSSSPDLCEALASYGILQALRVEPWAAFVRYQMTPYASNGERSHWHTVWTLSISLVTRLLRTLSLSLNTLQLALDFLNAHSSRFLSSLDTHQSSFQARGAGAYGLSGASSVSLAHDLRNSSSSHHSASTSASSHLSSRGNTTTTHGNPQTPSSKRGASSGAQYATNGTNAFANLFTPSKSDTPSSHHSHHPGIHYHNPFSSHGYGGIDSKGDGMGGALLPSYITLAALEETERITALIYELSHYKGRWRLALESEGGLSDVLELSISSLFQRVSLLLSHASDIVSGSKAVSSNERKSLAAAMAKAKDEKKKTDSSKDGKTDTKESSSSSSSSSTSTTNAPSSSSSTSSTTPAPAKKVTFATLPKIGAPTAPKTDDAEDKKADSDASDKPSGDATAVAPASNTAAPAASEPKVGATPPMARSLAMSQMIGKGDSGSTVEGGSSGAMSNDSNKKLSSVTSTSAPSSSKPSSGSSASGSSSSSSRDVPFLEHVELLLFRILRNTISCMRLFAPRVFSSASSSNGGVGAGSHGGMNGGFSSHGPMGASSGLNQLSSGENMEMPILRPATEATVGEWPTMGLMSLLISSCVSTSKKLTSTPAGNMITTKLPLHLAEELKLCAFAIETSVLLLTSHIHLYISPSNPDELTRRRVRDEIGYELESTVARLLKDWSRFIPNTSPSANTLAPAISPAPSIVPPFLMHAHAYLQSLQRR